MFLPFDEDERTHAPSSPSLDKTSLSHSASDFVDWRLTSSTFDVGPSLSLSILSTRYDIEIRLANSTLTYLLAQRHADAIESQFFC